MNLPDSLVYQGWSPNTPYSQGHPLFIEQALWEMPQSDWDNIVSALFNNYAVIDVSINGMIALIKETNTCTKIEDGYEIWVDKEGNFKIKVFDA